MPENAPDFAKIIAKAWRDPAFKAELIANPAAALKAEGIDVPAGMAVNVLKNTDKQFHLVLPLVDSDELCGMTVTVLENTDKQYHLVLPPVPTDELSDEALDVKAWGFADEMHFMNDGEQDGPEFAKVIAKAWRDSAFKAELIANPAAALKAEGIDVPTAVTVTVVENTDKQYHLVLPLVDSDELSD